MKFLNFIENISENPPDWINEIEVERNYTENFGHVVRVMICSRDSFSSITFCKFEKLIGCYPKMHCMMFEVLDTIRDSAVLFENGDYLYELHFDEEPENYNEFLDFFFEKIKLRA